MACQRALECQRRSARDRAATRYQTEASGAQPFAARAASRETTSLGKLASGWQVNGALRAWASVAQGYKPRGYNLAPSNPADALGFARERATSYEVGARWRGEAIQADMALYRIDAQDAQMYGDANMGFQTLENTGNTRSTGIEASVEWALPHPLRAWTLGGAAFFNRATFRSYTASSACTDCAGNSLPFAPRNSQSLFVRGHWPLGGGWLAPQLSLRRVGAHYFNNGNTLRQASYALLDATLAWRPRADVEIAAYVHNLTDRAWRSYGFLSRGEGYAQAAPGRTLGLSVTHDW